MNEIVFTACCTVAAIELLSYLAGKERSFKTVCGLAVTLVIVSLFFSLAEEIKPGLSVSFGPKSAVNELYLTETEKVLNDQIVTALSAAGVYDVYPEVILSMDDSGEVEVTALKVGIKHQADLERAEIILDNLFSGMVKGEVYCIDG